MEAVLSSRVVVAGGGGGPSLVYSDRLVRGFVRQRPLPCVRSARVGGDESAKLDDGLLLQAAMKPKTNWLHFFFNRPESRPFRSQPESELFSPTPDSPSPSPSCDGEGGNESAERKLWKSPHFTAEKARILRTQMRASETWHDAMYHSSIASKLATTHHPPPVSE